MAGLVYGQDQPTSLGWQSLCMPIPQDFELNTFLQKLADEITDEDLQILKTLLHGLFIVLNFQSSLIIINVQYFLIRYVSQINLFAYLHYKW